MKGHAALRSGGTSGSKSAATDSARVNSQIKTAAIDSKSKSATPNAFHSLEVKSTATNAKGSG